jgi:hypothetical protein
VVPSETVLYPLARYCLGVTNHNLQFTYSFLFQVDLKTQALSARFRSEGARLSRTKQDGFSGIYFNPSVTLSTRVRIEVLKALSNLVTNSQQLAYCTFNGPRPKLSVGPPTGVPGRRNALFYAPAIKKYGYLLEDKYLEKAYARAQMFFSGNAFKVDVFMVQPRI